jgi:hypothetical protein
LIEIVASRYSFEESFIEVNGLPVTRNVLPPAVIGEQTLKDLVAEAKPPSPAGGAGAYGADRIVLALLPADAAQAVGGVGVPVQQHRVPASDGVVKAP